MMPGHELPHAVADGRSGMPSISATGSASSDIEGIEVYELGIDASLRKGRYNLLLRHLKHLREHGKVLGYEPLRKSVMGCSSRRASIVPPFRNGAVDFEVFLTLFEQPPLRFHKRRKTSVLPPFEDSAACRGSPTSYSIRYGDRLRPSGRRRRERRRTLSAIDAFVGRDASAMGCVSVIL